jgi:exosortase/archaeosortase family protein
MPSKSKKALKNKKPQGKTQYKELFKALLPLMKSFALWMVLVIIVAWDYTNHRWFSMLFVEFTTYLSWALAKLMGIQAAVLGHGSSMMTTLEVNYLSIVIHNYPMIVELECSAYHAYIAMIALVIFSSWTVKQKLINGAFIFTILALINSLRIILLGVIGRKYPEIFNIMHDYIWNILLVIVIWGLWEVIDRRMQNKKQKKETAKNK